eukprot:m.66968 g.66968  ORF g.66968 m.66968 type:complete len:964 (+) comp11849_c0_seq1:166-3057(+)
MQCLGVNWFVFSAMKLSNYLFSFAVVIFVLQFACVSTVDVKYNPYNSEQLLENRYNKLAKSTVPFASIGRVNTTNVTEIARACMSRPDCKAFTSDGDLKPCADCGLGEHCCVFPQGQPYDPADSVDLYIDIGQQPPSDWMNGIEDGYLIYSSPEANVCYMPEIGNGYVASVIGFASTHVAGLYNGACGSVHKARLPSPIAGVSLENVDATKTQAVLDTKNGVYIRRYHTTSGSIVEQRLYAHRTRMHILVTEFSIISNSSESVDLQINSLFSLGCKNPLENGTCTNPGGKMVHRPDGSSYPYYGLKCIQDSDCGSCFVDGTCACGASLNGTTCCLPRNGSCSPPSSAGSGCAGGFTTDFTWTEIATQGQYSMFQANTSRVNDNGRHEAVAIVTDNIPKTITIHEGETLQYIAAVSTSVGFGSQSTLTPDAMAVVNDAKGHYMDAKSNSSSLLQEHSTEWQTITTRGVFVKGSGQRAYDIQSHLATSFYYLISSIREDWTYGGMSPGGLATQNYQGAVFMDQEFYSAGGLLLLHPELTKSAAQYRINSLPTAQQLATKFGYKGAMFAWTSAALGNPFGCCNYNKNGEGYEDCIEQHITPDVGFFFQQIYRATGNVTWLEETFPTLAGIADWIVSRVRVDSNNVSHIDGVMPIDEWCDQASGCAKPGVNDDPQMNAVSKAAIGFAVEAANILGKPPNTSWETVRDTILIPMDETHGVHAMPVGANGIPVVKVATKYMDTSSHTSCPEDVNYLTYPMGPSLNVSENLSRADMQFWSDGTKTCLENAGMTGPIHAISWLKMYPPNMTGAELGLNRSMLACAYGPFNVRNEVDVHNTTVGGHFNNTHFITGDGGFVQILINGYGGLMLATEKGMRLNLPTLPHGVDAIMFRGLQYRGFTVDYSLNSSHITMNTTFSNLYTGSNINSNSELCIMWDNNNHFTITNSPQDILLTQLPFVNRVEVTLGVCV